MTFTDHLQWLEGGGRTMARAGLQKGSQRKCISVLSYRIFLIYKNFNSICSAQMFCIPKLVAKDRHLDTLVS